MDRRSFIRTAAASGLALGAPRLGAIAPDRRRRPRPTRAQLAWQRDELAMFLHFGVNTFTDREWGDGHEDPRIFAPARLDARQWARSARAAGFRAMILTAKHHDGFCLWPTATTTHSVASSPFRDGHGDVVSEFVDACRAEGLRPGLYLSPWDRNHPAYGDSPRYNDVYATQLTELLTRYGSLAEVWFDGANGEGPNGKRQQYDWPRFFGIVKRFQPDAVIFSDAGPDVRWCGNEAGQAGDPDWSCVDPAAVPYPGASGADVIPMLQHGDPDGLVWRPAEADVSIRPGWFYHPADDARVRDVDNLMSLYFTSVGRNSKLLLNVPPTRDGLLHDTDVARLQDFRARREALFARDVTHDAVITWSRAARSTRRADIRFARPTTIATSRLAEDIAHGQRVSGYTIEAVEGGTRRSLARGTTVGYAKLDRFTPAVVTRVLVAIDYLDAAEPPPGITIRLFAPAG